MINATENLATTSARTSERVGGTWSAEWGPVHECPRCGAEVQVWRRRYGRLPMLVGVGTRARHRCGPPPVVGDIFECACGQVVRVLGDVRYDYATGRRHSCRYHPLSQAAPRSDESHLIVVRRNETFTGIEV